MDAAADFDHIVNDIVCDVKIAILVITGLDTHYIFDAFTGEAICGSTTGKKLDRVKMMIIF